MIYGSVCSGIEAASVAWKPLGWRPAFLAEIDPHACYVLHEHYGSGRPRMMPHPRTAKSKEEAAAMEAAITAVAALPKYTDGCPPNAGNFTTIESGLYEPIDLLCGGTPCQDFSVAGLRAGIAGERGNLTLEYVRLAKELKPKWLVWENVPGVLSQNGGRDFAAFLGGLAECGYGFAYRVLDAQYFGVPQRRRRVVVIGYFGDWRPAAAVLFERESLQRDLTPQRKTRSRVAGAFEVGPAGGGFTDVAPTLDTRCKNGPIQNQLGMGGVDVAPTLNAGSNKTGGNRQPGTGIETAESLIIMAHGQGGAETSSDLCPTLNCNHEAPELALHGTAPTLTSKPYGDQVGREEMLVAHTLRGEGFDASEDGTGRGVPLVPVAFDCKASGQAGFGASEDNTSTMRAMASTKNHQNGGGHLAIAIPINMQSATKNGAKSPNGIGVGEDGDPSPTLGAGDKHAVAFAQNSRNELRYIGGDGQVAGALVAQPGMKQQTYLQQSMHVRRLIPMECERLQGFPDNYTLVPYKSGKPMADGPRYKMLGNSWAVPKFEWIGQRIQMVQDLINNGGFNAMPRS